MRDEVIAITKMSELVDWICNIQSEKDIQAILEKSTTTAALKPRPMASPKDNLMSKKALAAKLGISLRAIERHPDQFVGIQIGARKLYDYNKCLSYQKKRGL